MATIKIEPVRVPKVIAPYDDLFKILSSRFRPTEGDILAISSKVVSLCEGRVVKKSGTSTREKLILAEAERYVPRKFVPGARAILTVKNSALTVAAGVDEFDGMFVLWPKDPFASARRIHQFLRKKFHIRKIGVIITDSHTVPLRRGPVGFALAFWGFEPLRFYRGRENVMGRKMRMSRANLADGLAAAAVLAMGEGGERTPIARISGFADVKFISGQYRSAEKFSGFSVKPEEDFFRPIMRGKIWRTNKKGPN